jgi:predicted glutamine amidotransferase
MCIIAWHPESAKIMKKETLNICWKNNDDGAGIAYWNDTDKTWHVKKGFMSWESFWNAFKEFNFKESDEFILHFRTGTSGGIRPGTTHPFPVCNNTKDMEELDYRADQIVFHNGIHSNGNKTESDTQLAIKNWIYPLLPLIETEGIEYCLKQGLDEDYSKWVITNKENIHFIGCWYEDEKTGIWYSKENDWKRLIQEVRYSNHWGNYNKNYAHKNISNSDNVISFDKYYFGNKYFAWATFKRDSDDFFNSRVIKTTEYSDSLNSDDSPHYEFKSCKICGVSTVDINDDNTCFWCAQNIKFDDDEDKEYQISDNIGRVLAIVDNNGDIIWDDSIIKDTMDICPSCMESTHLMESPYNDSDSLCTLCGAVFSSVTGEIIRYEPESDKGAKNNDK